MWKISIDKGWATTDVCTYSPCHMRWILWYEYKGKNDDVNVANDMKKKIATSV